MRIIPVKTPTLIKKVFPNFIWNINTKRKVLYLSFDDGPTPNITTWVLKTLSAYNAKATFFCIGNNIEKHPDIFKHIIGDGHTIGNHTYNHLNGWRHKTKPYLEDVLKTQTIITSEVLKLKDNTPEKVALQIKKLFRPPYGRIKLKQVKTLLKKNYKIIMWDVLSFDWEASISEDTCLKNIISNAQPGSIIVCHDSDKAYKNLKYTLPKVLHYYTKKGYVFEAL